MNKGAHSALHAKAFQLPRSMDKTFNHLPKELDNSTAQIERSMYRTFTRLVRSALKENLIQQHRLSHSDQNGNAVFELETHEAKIRIICKGAFTCWHIANVSHMEIRSLEGGLIRRTRNPIEVLEVVRWCQRSKLPERRWESILREIHNNIYNDAHCIAFREAQDVRIAEDAAFHGAKNLFDWVRVSFPERNSLIFFEQWGAVGADHHPCSKTKLGFSTEDLFRYAPEFGAVIPITVLAARRDRLITKTKSEVTEFSNFFADTFRDTMARWRSSLIEQHLDPNCYAPIPTHPWQLKEVISRRFSSEFEDMVLVHVKDAAIPCRATISMRTLCPIVLKELPHIKVPISVQATSAIRDLYREPLAIGPVMSNILESILEEDSELRNIFSFAPELVSIDFKERAEGATGKRSRLAAVIRKNVEALVRADEMVVPVAALLVRSPISRKPLLVETMDCVSAGKPDLARQYVDSYLKTAVAAYFGIFVRYGIALEGHQQNTLVVFDSKYRPVRFIARDLGSTLIVAESARWYGWNQPDLISSNVLRENRAEVREHFNYTVLQNHIGDLIEMLVEHAGLERDRLWRVVKTEMLRVMSSSGNYPGADTLEQDTLAFFHRPWRLKSYLEARLLDAEDDFFMDSKNPLS